MIFGNFPTPQRIPAMSERKKALILVIDSSAANRRLIGECLAQLPDAQTLTAGDGTQALQLFRERSPSLVLMDIALPDIDGLAVAREIRRLENSPERRDGPNWTPVVLLSSVMDEDILARGILAGADDFLYKPVSEIVLLAKVRAMLRIVALQQDIHEAHRQLKELSTLDGLTGIPNRRHFDETLGAEWKRCLRLDAPLSLIISDVDFFKQFNDIYGHQAGDACLRTVAGALHESLFRVEDTVARYGGEEFAAILPGTDIEGALAVAERMRRSTRELRIPHDRGIDGLISCSFGAACITPTASETPMKLLQSADSGLYIAKRDGRNRVTQTPL